MRLIRNFIHKDAIDANESNTYTRPSARAIVTKGEEILLLYTKRYDDYSIPGGGIDSKEDVVEGLKRELYEETGAKDIKVISEFGIYSETKPVKGREYQYINMISHYYICDIHEELGNPNLEEYEVNNGMEARWINIYEAIEHNKNVIERNDENIGLYVDRELFMLELIAEELISSK